MEIYELRKIVSKNKKYKYIYQLIIDGKVVNERKSIFEYTGCIVDGSKIKTCFSSENIALVISTFWAAKQKREKLALTFDALKFLKHLSI